jgi:hypothetical protein
MKTKDFTSWKPMDEKSISPSLLLLFFFSSSPSLPFFFFFPAGLSLPHGVTHPLSLGNMAWQQGKESEKEKGRRKREKGREEASGDVGEREKKKRNAKREPFVRLMSISFQRGTDNEVKKMNSNGKDSGYWNNLRH